MKITQRFMYSLGFELATRHGPNVYLHKTNEDLYFNIQEDCLELATEANCSGIAGKLPATQEHVLLLVKALFPNYTI